MSNTRIAAAANSAPTAATAPKAAVKAKVEAIEAKKEAMEALKAELRALKAELKAKEAGPRGLSLKVSVKGAISVYGLGRFPVTLYRGQWDRLLDEAATIKAFAEAHASELSAGKVVE